MEHARPQQSGTDSTSAATGYDSLPTRRSLLSRLRNMGDDASWRAFFDAYWRLIYNVARKSGLSDEDAQDVVQETVISVAKKMPEFRYDPAKGSFKRWLLIITQRRIHDRLRRHYQSVPTASISAAEDMPASVLAPDAAMQAAWEEEWQKNVFHAALARVRQKVNPKHFQVFDYCVLQNMRASEVARRLGLTAAQVYLNKHRTMLAVKRAVKEVEVEMEHTR
jgi:RNA polymerase sigma-70 factor (ECF subfamily)